MTTAAAAYGLRFAGEIFADRGYGDDGRLLARDQPGALLALTPTALGARAVAMVTSRSVVTHTGRVLPQAGATLCLHGDDPAVLPRAEALRAALHAAAIAVLPLSSWS